MILTLIGARPQFIKAAVVSKAFLDSGIKEIIVHSGQHYEEKMSQVFWDELRIPHPFANLNVGSGSHSAQTAQILVGFEKIILELAEFPEAVLLYGDTNTTIAGALVASKMHIPVIHIEAGLRSFNREMPEEINRVITDHVSDILFCPSDSAVEQLKKEGITKNVFNVGDVMYDSFLAFSAIATKHASIKKLVGDLKDFILLTLHRPVNTDKKENLEQILSSLGQLDSKIIWPVHPRNRANLNKIALPQNIRITEPLTYFEMLLALEECSQVITDSGGLQKESYWAKKPCITLRDETEWTETLVGNWNQLAKDNNLLEKINIKPKNAWSPLYGKGDAARQIASITKKLLAI
ncbi:MAG: UDP-N-acetylglucosamine 2-epimerase (non-hydrolyzing) [Bacteroidetes bacterium]|nr:MAG: UDP-N-acetylglucosamine 2-epimerase (non-hydrolyzing) [Bacteroidota bacterium]